MKEILLTQAKVALVDDEDFEWLSQWKWCYIVGGYAVRSASIKFGGKKHMIYMHRLIMDTPLNMECDHVNSKKLDNQRKNLRNCTIAENRRNTSRPKNNTTGFKGVVRSRGRYAARIKLNKRQMFLGRFDTAEEAARVYDDAAIKHHGKFAKLNFPIEGETYGR